MHKQFAERLKDVRMRQGLSQAELAAKIGITAAAVGNWEMGSNLPAPKSIKKLSDGLGVSVDYLLGKETILQEKPAPYGTEKPNVSEPFVYFRGKHRIPVVSWAQAGLGGNYADCEHQIEEWIDSDCQDLNAYALIVEGESMQPDFKPNDRVVFLPNSEARNGEVVVARLEKSGDVYLKLFHTDGKLVKLTSYNPTFPPMEYKKSEFRFIHPMYELRRMPRRK